MVLRAPTVHAFLLLNLPLCGCAGVRVCRCAGVQVHPSLRQHVRVFRNEQPCTGARVNVFLFL